MKKWTNKGRTEEGKERSKNRFWVWKNRCQAEENHCRIWKSRCQAGENRYRVWKSRYQAGKSRCYAEKSRRPVWKSRPQVWCSPRKVAQTKIPKLKAFVFSAFVLSVICAAGLIAGATQTAFADDVVYDQAGARSMLSNVNNLRANEAWITLQDGSRYQFPQALEPYSWDSGLEKVAMLRAKEISQSFSHTRPNGTLCFSAYTELGVSTPSMGENIAMGYWSVESVMNGWAEANEPYDGQGHRRNMLGDYTCIGIAHCIVNGVNYWVQEFGSESSSSTWKRLSGGSSLTTMKAIVNEGWETSDYAIVATSKGYHDALSAGALAGLLDAPVMLTDPNNLSNVTKNLITAKQVKNVIVVGGEKAISPKVYAQIGALGVWTKRVAGGTAAATARKVYAEGLEYGGWGTDAILTTCKTYQDALSIAPYAYAKKAPIFLTDTNKTTPGNATLKLLSTFSRTLIVGGNAAVSETVDAQVSNAKRLQGGTAYSTCKKVANFCVEAGMEVSHMGVATGKGYQDVLCGAVLLGKKNSVLLLVDSSNSTNIANVIDKNRSSLQSWCYVFGGTSAICPTLWNKVIGL